MWRNGENVALVPVDPRVTPVPSVVASRPLGEVGASDTPETDAIRTEIARTRTRVMAAMDDLHAHWEEVTDWRKLVARRPWAWALGAAGAGVLVAMLFRPRTVQVIRVTRNGGN